MVVIHTPEVNLLTHGDGQPHDEEEPPTFADDLVHIDLGTLVVKRAMPPRPDARDLTSFAVHLPWPDRTGMVMPIDPKCQNDRLTCIPPLLE